MRLDAFDVERISKVLTGLDKMAEFEGVVTVAGHWVDVKYDGNSGHHYISAITEVVE